MKKFMSLFMAAAGMFCAIGLTACGGGSKAKDPTDGLKASVGLAMTKNTEIEDLAYEDNYTIAGEYYVVTGIGECTDTDLVIPKEYNGLPVKAIGGFMGNGNITSVVLNDNIEVIRALAFGRTSALKSFTFGNNVVIVEHCAFGTTGLTKLDLGPKVRFVGWECFHHASIATLGIRKSIKTIEYSIFNGDEAIETINYEGSEDDWKKVAFDDNNDDFKSAKLNYNVKF